MENVGIVYDHLEYMYYGHIWWSFDKFPPFWYIVSRKIWQLCLKFFAGTTEVYLA
jgi:hypothetical protein